MSKMDEYGKQDFYEEEFDSSSSIGTDDEIEVDLLIAIHKAIGDFLNFRKQIEETE